MTYFSDPPGQPVIEGYNPNGYAEAGESLSLKCISSGGNPTANLKWFRGVYSNCFFLNLYHIYLTFIFYTTLCDKVCQWLVTGQWFSLGTSVFVTNKTDCHNITDILLKVVLNTINTFIFL